MIPDAQQAQPQATQPDAMTSRDAPAAAPIPSVVVARAGRYYRNARFIMVTLVIGFGAYFLYDGFIAYPKKNDVERAKPENINQAGEFIGKLPYSEWDIFLQKALGFAMPPLGLAYLAFFMRRSRGEYRMENQQIAIPGHPPFHIDEVTKLDKKLWDRKGIAVVSYETASGQKGAATLDDFIYDRKPTDQIYDAIVANLKDRAAST